jgi:hypothetical protein
MSVPFSNYYLEQYRWRRIRYEIRRLKKAARLYVESVVEFELELP